MGYRVINGALVPIERTSQSYESLIREAKGKNIPKENSFNDILSRELKTNETFTVSNHAAERMKDITLDKEAMEKLNEGINKAEDKGCKNCLLLYNDVAFIASIKNRTIITAVDNQRSKENVFTNIDGVVIL